jgi:hypothetical protein
MLLAYVWRKQGRKREEKGGKHTIQTPLPAGIGRHPTFVAGFAIPHPTGPYIETYSELSVCNGCVGSVWGAGSKMGSSRLPASTAVRKNLSPSDQHLFLEGRTDRWEKGEGGREYDVRSSGTQVWVRGGCPPPPQGRSPSVVDQDRAKVGMGEDRREREEGRRMEKEKPDPVELEK